MKRKTHHFPNGDRYALDFDACSARNGFAQIDTDSDAWYFGQWANPHRLRYVSFCEGDLTILDFDSAAEFARFIVESIASRDGFRGIDTMCNQRITRGFCAAGLGRFLH